MFIIAEVHGEICVQELELFLLQKKVIKIYEQPLRHTFIFKLPFLK